MDLYTVVSEILGPVAGYESIVLLIAGWAMIYCLVNGFAILAHVFKLVGGGK